jgi:hypothetical protein
LGCWSFTLDVKPIDADILIGGDAGATILRLVEGAPVPKVRIKGSAGLLKVLVEKTEAVPSTPQSPPFEWPDPSPGLITDERELAVLVVPGAVLEVALGHSAIILVDGHNIGQVGPKRYTRTDFPELRKPVMGRPPRWEALVVDSRPFHLAFRVGPFPTSDPVRVAVEFGVIARVQPERVLDLWLGPGPERRCITAADLKKQLESGVANVVRTWLHECTLAQLQPSFRQRETLTLALEAELGSQLAQAGLAVEGVTAIDFICPGQKRIEAIRETTVRQRMEEDARRGNR